MQQLRFPDEPTPKTPTAHRWRLGASVSRDARTRELEAAIGELKSAQEMEVRQARLKAMGELAGGMSHDFNNALSSVLLRVALLRRHIDADGARHLDVIESTVHEAAATVRRLQEFARDRDLEAKPVAVDVNVLLRDAAQT